MFWSELFFMILGIEICVNVVNWIHIVNIFLMTVNIEISMNLVNLIQIVLIIRTSF